MCDIVMTHPGLVVASYGSTGKKMAFSGPTGNRYGTFPRNPVGLRHPGIFKAVGSIAINIIGSEGGCCCPTLNKGVVTAGLEELLEAVESNL